jgi:hypothetical protein
MCCTTITDKALQNLTRMNCLILCSNTMISLGRVKTLTNLTSLTLRQHEIVEGKDIQKLTNL